METQMLPHPEERLCACLLVNPRDPESVAQAEAEAVQRRAEGMDVIMIELIGVEPQREHAHAPT